MRRTPPPPKNLDAALRTTARGRRLGSHRERHRQQGYSLINLKRCIPMPIEMANKTIVSAVYKGDMQLRLRLAADSPDQHLQHLRSRMCSTTC